jgi:hypothetical protein
MNPSRAGLRARIIGDIIVTMLATTEKRSRNRAEISDAFKWHLDDIYPDWTAWETALTDLERRIG